MKLMSLERILAAPAALSKGALAGLMLWTALASPAVAQGLSDMAPLLDRLQRLERDLQTLNVQIARGTMAPVAREGGAGTGAPPAPAGAASLQIRLGALEEEIRTLTGTFEGFSHQVQQFNQRLDKLTGDLDFRLGALERGGQPGAPRAQTAPLPKAVESAPPLGAREGVLGSMSERDLSASQAGVAAGPRPTPTPGASPARAPGILPPGPAKDQYDFAFGLLRQANYDQAELALAEFVNTHPENPLAGNARYWLGETHYVRGNHQKAAEVFAENYKLDPKGAKAPDTLLKLGMSLATLDKGSQACVTYGELRKKFPDAPQAIKTTLERERKRLACK
ncbi:MAG: tol-pal system protein YbgF [Rhodospirillales bacterium]|nr:tol-pal system protein YbgF [Rhodospirillales bacterium]MSP79510.1 tol-pal system protein YbgF [Rhodospirillales bacterium]